MKKIFSLFLVLTLYSSVVHAVVVQKIYLKNGSVLNGYVQQQDGQGNMVIKTDNAIICLQNENLSVTDNLTAIHSLTKEWKEWAEKNEAYVGTGDSRTLLLSNVHTGVLNHLDTIAVDPDQLDFESKLKEQSRFFSNVRILEKGSVIKFLELSPNTYNVSWKDIESIKAERRPKNALSGINRTYYLKSNREVSGQYAGETATTVSLYQNNGMIETVNFADVNRYTFSVINPNLDILSQSELIDVVKTRYHGDVRGIIIEQNYSGNKDSENYISIWEQGKSPQMIKISEIVSIGKEENTHYAPKFDILLKEGEVVVNRNPVEFVKVNDNEDYLVLDSISHKVIVTKDTNNVTRITVEYRNDNNPNVEIFQLVKVTKMLVKKNVIYCFSYKDLVNTACRATAIETSVNHTTKADYVLSGSGIYALYDAKNKKAIPIIVKP